MWGALRSIPRAFGLRAAPLDALLLHLRSSVTYSPKPSHLVFSPRVHRLKGGTSKRPECFPLCSHCVHPVSASSSLPGGCLHPTVHGGHRGQQQNGQHKQADTCTFPRPTPKLSITAAWEMCTSVQQQTGNNTNPPCICSLLPSLLRPAVSSSLPTLLSRAPYLLFLGKG